MTVSKRDFWRAASKLTLSLAFSAAGIHAFAKELDTPVLTCEKLHQKTISVCSAHEQTVAAETLSIVGHDTRSRVAQEAKGRLLDIKSRCQSLQQKCALTCDEQMETAAMDGADITPHLDRMQDCRQGEAYRHLRLISQKIADLKRILRQNQPREAGKVTINTNQADLLQ